MRFPHFSDFQYSFDNLRIVGPIEYFWGPDDFLSVYPEFYVSSTFDSGRLSNLCSASRRRCAEKLKVPKHFKFLILFSSMSAFNPIGESANSVNIFLGMWDYHSRCWWTKNCEIFTFFQLSFYFFFFGNLWILGLNKSHFKSRTKFREISLELYVRFHLRINEIFKIIWSIRVTIQRKPRKSFTEYRSIIDLIARPSGTG